MKQRRMILSVIMILVMLAGAVGAYAGSNPQDSSVNIDGLSAADVEEVIQAAIDDAGTYDVITVTGETTIADDAYVTLDIPAEITVCWQAAIYGGSPFYYESSSNWGYLGIIRLVGSGTLEVAEGGYISGEYAYAIEAVGPSVSILVSGGEVTTKYVTMAASGGSHKVTVTDGIVRSTGQMNSAIRIEGELSMTGGEVIATGSNAAAINIINADVTISGGKVTAAGVNGYAINAKGVNTTVTVTGGEINSVAYGLIIEGKISKAEVKGGTVLATGNTGEAISSWSGNNAIEISGGQVLATGTKGAAVRARANSTVAITGGLVYSSGQLIETPDNANGFAGFTGDSAYIQWDSAEGNDTYQANTSDDIISWPEDVSAKWSRQNDQHGIAYIYDGESGFIPLAVTVVE